MKPRTAVALTALGVALSLLVVAAVVVVAVRALSDDGDAPEATSSIAPGGGLERFYEQQVAWEDCGRNQCAWITVPVDYDDPDGETLQLRAVLIEAEGGKAERTLLVNPGGPGGSAIDYAPYAASQYGGDVREMYDVVGVDPRGIGESTPLECMDDAAFDEFINTDPTPDDADEVAEFRAASAALGKACEDEGGALASHVSTQEVARDMDVVRAVLGRDQLDWFGASYGTYIGATYAAIFPDKVGRMVLDGAVDPTMSAFDGAIGQTTGFQRALMAYAENCASGSRCPLGPSAEIGVRRIDALLKQLDAKPLGGGDRELTEGLAFYGIALPLYHKVLWPQLTTALRQAFNGDGSGLLALADYYFERENGKFANNSGEVIYAVNCLDASTRPDEQEVRDRLDEFTQISPVFGTALGWGVLGCTDWPLTSPLEPVDFTAAGAPPILVLGTTRDPATPYEWAETLADELQSGVLVSRDGDGHTAYGMGNRCIDNVVDAFLVNGTVPDSDPRC